MLVKLTEVCQHGTYSTQLKYSLKEVFINPEHVIMIREEQRMKQLNEQGELPEGLDQNHQFTKLTINRGQTGTDIVVVGAPAHVEIKLNKNSSSKQLLNG